MQKDASYHEAAVYYNEQLAIRAEELVEEINARFGDVEPVRWSRSVGKQHRFHEGRHTKALEKLQSSGNRVENTEDGGEDRVIEDERVLHRSAIDGEFVTAKEAAEHPDTTVTETIHDDIEEREVEPVEPQPVEDAADPSQAPSGAPGDGVFPQDSSDNETADEEAARLNEELNDGKGI